MNIPWTCANIAVQKRTDAETFVSYFGGYYGQTGKKSQKGQTEYDADRSAGLLRGDFFRRSYLWLPVCNQKPIEFIDALFTSVTSVCVTGLVTVIPAEQYTLFGQIVVLILIQIGGLGVIACLASFFLLLKADLHERRILIQEAYGLDTLSGLVKFYYPDREGTFIVEGIGAVLFSIKFVPEFGVARESGTASFTRSPAFVMRVSTLSEAPAYGVCRFASGQPDDDVPDCHGRFGISSMA